MTTKKLRSGGLVQPRLKPLNIALALALAQLGVAGTANAQMALLPRSSIPSVTSPSLPSGATVVQGANAPIVNQQTMTVEQTAPSAIINWNSFSIDKGHTVRFNQQGQKDWQILNRVVGTERSILNGVLQADGRVFLLNNNGILIGEGAQVNVHTFLASTLTISDKVFRDGYLSVGGQNAAFNAGTGSFAPKGNILIEPGAIVTSGDGGSIYFFASGNVYDVNGQPILVGAENNQQPIGLVQNGGSLRTTNGQVILAAGDKIFLRTPSSATDRPDKESYLGGVVVTVDAGGQVANSIKGYVESRLGNISMVGLTVNQLGRVTATTSVDRNGSIWLVAQDSTALDGTRPNGEARIATRGGKLTLGETSTTRVLPDLAAPERTTVDASPFAKSQIRLEGETIHLQGNSNGSGALVYAPSGNIEFKARTNPSDETIPRVEGSANFAADNSAIVLDSNVKVDVSGLRGRLNESGNLLETNGVPVPIERNSLRIELRGDQLADAPLLRDSGIARDPIFVDIRQGTTLINQASYRAAISSGIRRDIFERMTVGGRVQFNTRGSTVIQTGAQVNVAGGSIGYVSGTVRTSRLFDGRSYYGITAAPNDRRYLSVSDNLSRVESGYSQGQEAGSIEFGTRNLLLSGTVVGGSLLGPKQRSASVFGGSIKTGIFGTNDTYTSDDALDRGLLHSLEFKDQTSNNWPLYLASDANISGLLTSQFGENGAGITQSVSLADLSKSGMSSISLSTNGSIKLFPGNTFSLASGTELSLIGATGVDIQRSIRINAGKILLSSAETTSIGNNVNLDTSGLWLNDRLTTSINQPNKQFVSPTKSDLEGNAIAGTLRTLTNGGDVIVQGSTVQYGTGTIVDISSGLQVDSNSRQIGGRAGSMTSADGALPSTIIGYGFTAGGELKLNGRSALWAGVQAPINSFKLTDSLVSDYGLATFDLSFSSITIGSGTRLEPTLLQYQLPNRAYSVDGAALRALTARAALPTWQASRTSLTLSGITVDIQTGASIQMPTRGLLTLASSYRTTNYGALIARGGEITLSNKTLLKLGYLAGEGVQLLDGSLIDVSGLAVERSDPSLYKLGSVLNGGTVNINATGDEAASTIMFAPGAQIRLNGAMALFDIARSNGFSLRYNRQPVYSAAGSINVETIMGGVFAGRVYGLGGGPGASNARYTFKFDSTVRSNYLLDVAATPDGYTFVPTSERQYVIASASQTVPSNFALTGDFDLAINGVRPPSVRLDTSSREPYKTRLNPLRISSQSLQDAGDITLANGEVLRFEGADQLNASARLTISTPAIRTEADQVISLNAPWVRIGSDKPLVQPALPVGGITPKDPVLQDIRTNNSQLIVNASLGIDLYGQAYLQGAPLVRLNTPGAIRLEGEVSLNPAAGRLNVAQDLQLQANSIFPTSRSSFTINAPNGVVTISKPLVGAVPSTPSSVTGTLAINAQSIEQRGSIFAPLGEINLNATASLVLGAGSTTSVSGNGLLLPYGEITNGSWILPQGPLLASSVNVISPQKRISLNGQSVVVESAQNGNAPALVNTSGGGDFVASEFVAGPLGAINLFNAADAFAIVPSYTAPLAPLTGGQPRTTTIGSTLRIETAVNGLPAGNYVVLPASYAQLPGGFLVRPSIAAGASAAVDGASPIVSLSGISTVIGYREQADFGLRSQKPERFELLNPAQLRERMEIRESKASSFYTDTLGNGNLVQDAGTLRVVAERNLSLDGAFNITPDSTIVTPVKGLAGRVEISSSQQIQVSANASSSKTTDGIQIDASKLEQLRARELLIGGRLQENTIVTEALGVSIDAGVSINQPSVILASKGQLIVGDGVKIVASDPTQVRGPANQEFLVAQEVTNINSTGSLVAVTSDQRVFKRAGTSSAANASVSVGAESQLNGATVAVDSTGSSTISTSSVISGTDNTQLGTRTILVGTPPSNETGLYLSPSILNSLGQTANATLTAYDSITAYGNVSLGSESTRTFVLDSPAIKAGEANTNFSVNAQSIQWNNQRTTSLVAAETIANGGNLLLNATGTAGNSIVLGQGNKRIGGFSSTQIQVGSSPSGSTLKLDKNGSLLIAGNAQISSNSFIGSTVGDHSIGATGSLELTQRFPNSGAVLVTAADAGVGAKLDLTGGSVTVDTALNYKSGEVNIRSTNSNGTLALTGNASIDLSGFSQPVFDQQINLAGGRIKMAAEGTNSQLQISAGASINVAAANNAAGAVDITASGNLNLSAEARINAGQADSTKGGSFTVDAQRGAVLDDIAGITDRGGFNRLIDIRARTGDLKLDESATLKSRTVRVAVDNGALDVSGKIDARATDGGTVELWQRSTTSTLNINNGAQIDASGITGGGDVTIGSTKGILISGASEMRAGSSDGRDQGRLTLRAPRTGAGSGTGVAISAATPTSKLRVSGRVNTVVEGVRNNLAFATSVGSTSPRSAIDADVTAFLGNASSIATNIPITTTTPAKLSAGIEFNSVSNLVTSATTLDFSSTTGLGALTIRSSENLTIAGTMTDGVTSANQILRRDSWSFRLAAGADLNAANPNAVGINRNTDTTADGSRRGVLTINAGNDILTGTGSITLSAADQIRLRGGGTSIYTFGRQAELADGYVVGTGYFGGNNSATTNGGAVTLRAGGDIVGNNLATNTASWTAGTWLLRQGVVDPATGLYSRVPGWLPSVVPFNLHVGSLGGGAIDISGRDVSELFVGSATAGRMRSTAANPEALEVINKAPVRVAANRDIVGGQFLAMGTSLDLIAGSNIRVASGLNGATTPMHSDNTVNVIARSQVQIASSSNPTLLPITTRIDTNTRTTDPIFSTYGSNSLLNVSSPGEIQFLKPYLFAPNGDGAQFAARLGSPNLTIQSGSSISLDLFPIRLAPTLRPEISLLAINNINSLPSQLFSQSTLSNYGNIENLSYLVPSPTNDRAALNAKFPKLQNPNGTAARDGVVVEPARFYAANGDVGVRVDATNPLSVMEIKLNQPVHIKAGRDVRQLVLEAQNNTVNDETIVSAGRDVINTAEIINGNLNSNSASIEVAGPGTLIVQAGRDIRLGAKTAKVDGISTIGDAKVSELPTGGASIVLIAGLEQSPRYEEMLDYYLKPDSAGISFDKDRYVDLANKLLPVTQSEQSSRNVWIGVQALSKPQRDQLARSIFFSELRLAGGPDTTRLVQTYLAPNTTSNEPQRLQESLAKFITDTASLGQGSNNWEVFRSLPLVKQAEFVSLYLIPDLLKSKIILANNSLLRDYARGYQAATRMFEGDGKGNIDLAYSSVRANQGGSVQLIAPGTICRTADAKACFGADSTYSVDPRFGNVRVGLANPPPGTATTSSGVFGLGGADVSVYLGNSMDINTSRVVTGGGGDLLLWSSGGSIDAGRGSKAAISAPPPVFRFDKVTGAVTFDLSNAIQGSGIRAVSFSDKVPAGEVSLFAPKGTIDAGDAGIQGGSINVGAAVLLNADNIRLASDPTGGTIAFDSSGNAGTIAPASSGNSGVGNVVPKEAQGGNTERAVRRTRIVIVDFEGFGVDCKEKPDDPSCKPKPN